jgi:hypothetical protein
MNSEKHKKLKIISEDKNKKTNEEIKVKQEQKSVSVDKKKDDQQSDDSITQNLKITRDDLFRLHEAIKNVFEIILN